MPLPPPEMAEVVDQFASSVVADPVPDLALLNVLVWARARGVLSPAAALLLWDLVVLASDSLQRSGREGMARGTGSLEAAAKVGNERGLTPRTVRRQRDRAVSALRLVQNEYARDHDGGDDLRAVSLVGAGACSGDGSRS